MPSNAVSICVPWRSDHGWRETLFDWVRPAWESTGFNVCVGVDDDGGPINVSRALNRARAQSTADVLVIAAADHIPHAEAVREAVAAAKFHGWAPIFTSTAGITLDATKDLITGRRIDVSSTITAEVPFCTALLAVRADVWDDAGGWDERFHGWGCEDTAFRLVLDTLYPHPPTLTPRRTIALWHEGASRDRFDANAALLGEYLVCADKPTDMRALIARRSL